MVEVAKQIDGMDYFQPTKEFRQYQMLDSIKSAKGTKITQREISDASKISPSVVNKYLEQFLDDELIVRKEINKRDHAYELTDKGQRQHRKRMIEYIRETFQLFSTGKSELGTILRNYKEDYDIESLMFYSAGEVTELLLHAIQNTGMDLLAIVDDDPEKQGSDLFGYPVIARNGIASYNPDAIIITTFRYRKKIHDKVSHAEDEYGIDVLGF